MQSFSESPEVIFIEPRPDSRAAADAVLSILIERGIWFAFETGDALPADLPDSLDSARVLVIDPLDERMRHGRRAERIKEFRQRGGRVHHLFHECDPAMVVGESQLRWQAESIINTGRLTQQHPRMLSQLAERPLARLIEDIWDACRHYWDHYVGWADPQGWFWLALERMHQATSDHRYADALVELVDRSIADVPNQATHFNEFCGLNAVLGMHERTGEQRYLDFARERLNRLVNGQLDALPNHVLHDPNHDVDIWPESLAMTCGPLARLSRITGDDRYVDRAIRAVDSLARWCVDPHDGLWFHGALADGQVGCKWGRGNGWALLGIRELLLHLDANHPWVPQGIDLLRRFAHGANIYQDVRSGCWRNVLDHPNARLEMTCTAMITGTFTLGLRMKWFDDETITAMVARGWRGLRSKLWRGRLCTQSVGTGLANDPQYYVGRPQAAGRPTHAIGCIAEVLLMERQRRNTHATSCLESSPTHF